MSPRPASAPRTVNLVTLGCARNEVDSEELAARLTAAGWELTEDGDASVVLVNTCGFIQAAKQESIDELLAAAESGAKVAAVGCLAERYGAELAGELPEAQVLSFDDYDEIGARLDDVLAGRKRPAHVARDRRTLLPISPAERQPLQRPAPPEAPAAPWTGPDGGVFRRRLSGGVVAPLKIASGCDRRCSFCAIPSFRGAFVSRRPPEILAEARWLAANGVRELVLVSENSTSYGKDLGNLRLLEEVLPDLAATEGIERVRISYLQPAELRPGLIEVIAATPGRGALLRPVVPARQRPGAAGHAAVRRPGAVSCPPRPDQGAEPAGRGAVQLHRRLPRRDRGGPGRARGVPEPSRARRDRDLRLLRRGRHRGGIAARARWTRRRSPAGSRSSPGWPTS